MRGAHSRPRVYDAHPWSTLLDVTRFTQEMRRLGISLLGAALGSLGAAATPPTHLLVVDKAAGQLVVLDLASGEVAQRIDVGYGPHEVVAVSAADSPTGGPLALVSLYGDGGRPGSELAVVDLTQGDVRLISLEPYLRPHGLALVPGTAGVLVTVEHDDTVLLVDYPRGQVTATWAVAARLPHMVVATADGSAGYASSITGAGVTRLPLLGGGPLTVPVGGGAEGIAVTGDGAEVWVGSNDEHEVHVLSAGLDTLAVLPTCEVPIRITPVGDGLMAATCYGANMVQLFDIETREVLSGIELPGDGGRPVGTLATPDGSLLYVATTADGRVHEIDVASGTVLRSFAAGSEPDGLALVTLAR